MYCKNCGNKDYKLFEDIERVWVVIDTGYGREICKKCGADQEYIFDCPFADDGNDITPSKEPFTIPRNQWIKEGYKSKFSPARFNELKYENEKYIHVNFKEYWVPPNKDYYGWYKDNYWKDSFIDNRRPIDLYKDKK